jgi:hypothetical protein
MKVNLEQRVNIEKQQILKNIYLLKFDNQLDLTSTFLRFSEFYESPEFRNKIFTLEEYKKWYTQIKGKFSYYEDWCGFNIPSNILTPFYEGKFNPLTAKEKQLLELFNKEKGDFYIIGNHKEDKSDSIKHEIAHALFYINSVYHNSVIELLKGFDLTNPKKELIKEGYTNEVLDDEVQAYAVDDSGEMNIPIQDELKHEIKDLFLKFYK